MTCYPFKQMSPKGIPYREEVLLSVVYSIDYLDFLIKERIRESQILTFYCNKPFIDDISLMWCSEFPEDDFYF